jgi:hypothetical protein
MTMTITEPLAHSDRDGSCIDREACMAAGAHKRPEPLQGRRIGPDGKKFFGGTIQAIYEVGDIQVAEYLEDCSNHSASQPYAWDRHGRTLFHAYVAGRSTAASHLSLDSALIYAIAYKREGANTRAAMYFERMTGNGNDA